MLYPAPVQQDVFKKDKEKKKETMFIQLHSCYKIKRVSEDKDI